MDIKYYEEVKKLERMFLTMITVLSCLSLMAIYYVIVSTISYESTHIEVAQIVAEPLDVPGEVYEQPVVTTCLADEVVVSMEEVEPDEIYCLTSKTFINNHGVETITSEVEVNMSLIPTDVEFEIPDWDYKEKIKDVEIIWEFLVNQQNVHPNVASGIIGCLYHEGTFGEQQGSKNYIESIEEARELLNKNAKSTGYGIAQWTFSSRRELLLKYYEEAFTIYPDDAYKASVVAELCCLIEELKGFNIFDDLSTVHSVEDATGRFAKLYECYSGCDNDWMKSNGSYKIATSDKSATKRLATAYDIYNHFMGE